MRFEDFNSREIAILRKSLRRLLSKTPNQSDAFVAGLLLAEIDKPQDLMSYLQPNSNFNKKTPTSDKQEL